MANIEASSSQWRSKFAYFQQKNLELHEANEEIMHEKVTHLNRIAELEKELERRQGFDVEV